MLLAAPWFGLLGLVQAAVPTQTSISAHAACDGDTWFEVWVLLSLPELASLPREQVAQREVLRQRIEVEQEQVMAGLRELGAIELARVQVVRNALAVRLPAAQLQAARELPGVRSVQVVRHVDRAPPVGPK